MQYLTRKTWHQFRSTGLLWFINTTLHMFGWAIVVDYEDIKHTIVKEAYPARCKFRGFSPDNIEKGYTKVTRYLKRNIKSLERDCRL